MKFRVDVVLFVVDQYPCDPANIHTTSSYQRETIMPRVTINTPAPDFTLADYTGRIIRLSDFCGRKNVFLVFNRTFV